MCKNLPCAKIDLAKRDGSIMLIGEFFKQLLRNSNGVKVLKSCINYNALGDFFTPIKGGKEAGVAKGDFKKLK